MVREWSGLILAGGKGARLMPLTSLVPKPLVRVTNVPMIDYSIAHLIYANVKHIVIALVYMGELLEDHVKNNQDFLFHFTLAKCDDVVTNKSDKKIKELAKKAGWPVEVVDERHAQVGPTVIKNLHEYVKQENKNN